MSLLLDALKKAADEKKKESSLTEANKAEKADPDKINDAEEMDLDLELVQEKNEPEFPEVNQQINRQAERKAESIEEPVKKAQDIELELGPDTEPVSDSSSIAKEDKSVQEIEDTGLDKTSSVSSKPFESEPVPSKEDPARDGPDQENAGEIKQTETDPEPPTPICTTTGTGCRD